jgi:hypothetical protein
VGRLFQINLQGQRKSKAVLQAVADEMMLELAKLMPEKYWGYYTNHEKANQRFLEYLD